MKADIKRLVLGTVQFGQDYVVDKLSPFEVYKILNYAYDRQIHTLDTAHAYGNYDIIRQFYRDTGKVFHMISKVKNIDELSMAVEYFPNMTTCLAHGFDEALLEDLKKSFKYKVGMSIYKKEEVRDCDVLQVPMIDEFLPLLDERYHLRSIFGRGEKLKDHTVEECLRKAFNTKAGKIVVGVDSLEHLIEIVHVVRNVLV